MENKEKVFWIRGFYGKFYYGEIVSFKWSIFSGPNVIIKVTKGDDDRYKVGSFISLRLDEIQAQNKHIHE